MNARSLPNVITAARLGFAGIPMNSLVALLCLILGIADSSCGAGKDAEGTAAGCLVPHVIVPRDLGEWRISVSVSGGRGYSRPQTEIVSGGNVVVKSSFSADFKTDLDRDRTEELFAGAAKFANAFYLRNDSDRQDRRDDLRIYTFQVASGGRAVILGFNQAEPSRMRLESEALTVLDIVNHALIRQGGLQATLPEPLRPKEVVRDPQEAGGTSVAPSEFPDGGHVIVKIVGARREVSIAVEGDRSRGTQILKVDDGEKEARVRLPGGQAQRIYDGIRAVLCEFKLQEKRNELAPASDQRLELGIHVGGRGIRIRFDRTDDIPAESRAALSRILDVVNAQLDPDHKKIELMPKTKPDQAK